MFKSLLIFLIIFSCAAVSAYVGLVYLLPMIRRKKMSSQEFPESWESVLEKNIPDFKDLNKKDQREIRSIVKVFMAEKYLEPDDELKWDEQILICTHIAANIYSKKHRYLGKLSTIRIGSNLNMGQGLLEVPSINALKEVDFKKWF